MCNGATVSANEYSGLVGLLQSVPSITMADTILGTGTSTFKPGRAGEIMYKDTINGNINLYNFDTNKNLTTSATGVIAFGYLPTMDVYAKSTWRSQTSSGYDTLLTYGEFITMSNQVTVPNLSLIDITEIDGIILVSADGGGNPGHTYVQSVQDLSTFTTTMLGNVPMQTETISPPNRIVKLGNSYAMMAYNSSRSGYTYVGIFPKTQSYGDKSIQSFTASTTNPPMFASDGTVALYNKGNTCYKINQSTTSSTVDTVSLPSTQIFGGNHGFFYVSNGILYNSVDHAVTWNKMANINVGTVYSIVDNPQDNKLYVMGSSGTAILSFANMSILLPTYSPAQQLYAYIRAKM